MYLNIIWCTLLLVLASLVVDRNAAKMPPWMTLMIKHDKVSSIVPLQQNIDNKEHWQ